MESHVCSFSIMRLASRYKGTDYEINECEDCGSMVLFAGAGREKRIVPKESSEFRDIRDVMTFLIQALER
jgi:hypothetical protein